jgi:hypothetical protein
MWNVMDRRRLDYDKKQDKKQKTIGEKTRYYTMYKFDMKAVFMGDKDYPLRFTSMVDAPYKLEGQNPEVLLWWEDNYWSLETQSRWGSFQRDNLRRYGLRTVAQLTWKTVLEQEMRHNGSLPPLENYSGQAPSQNSISTQNKEAVVKNEEAVASSTSTQNKEAVVKNEEAVASSTSTQNKEAVVKNEEAVASSTSAQNQGHVQNPSIKGQSTRVQASSTKLSDEEAKSQFEAEYLKLMPEDANALQLFYKMYPVQYKKWQTKNNITIA